MPDERQGRSGVHSPRLSQSKALKQSALGESLIHRDPWTPAGNADISQPEHPPDVGQFPKTEGAEEKGNGQTKRSPPLGLRAAVESLPALPSALTGN